MPSHDVFVAQFHAGLWDGTPPPGAAARTEVARRFATYRNNVVVSLTEALAVRFPVIQRLVGAEFFAALAKAYLQTDPPRSAVLAEWGTGFAAFLDDFPPLAAYPYMGDVARIEWARGLAFHAADAAPIDPAALIGANPDRLRLGLHGSVILLRLNSPAVTIWEMNQPGALSRALPGAEVALILRDPAFQVPVRALGPGDAALIAAILAGQTLTRSADAAQSAEAGHDPQALLVHLIGMGAVISAKE